MLFLYLTPVHFVIPRLVFLSTIYLVSVLPSVSKYMCRLNLSCSCVWFSPLIFYMMCCYLYPYFLVWCPGDRSNDWGPRDILSREMKTSNGITIKKFFRTSDKVCSFCSKKGHNKLFCPCVPTEPEVKIDFVERLITKPRIRLDTYEHMKLDEVITKIFKHGVELNQGNPWVSDSRPFSKLRRRLGFWKSIGCDNSVLSWLSYGYQMRFVNYPRRKLFRNSPSTLEHEKFIDDEIKAHIEDGSFQEVRLEDVKVVSPFVISMNSSGKPRRCDDMRYINGFLCSPFFKLQSLDKDVPNVVLPGQSMFTKDLEKAYYKIPIEEKSTYYQCFFWKGKYYRALVLLFGFCQAPFVFTKICRVIVRFCGALLIKLVNFVDDFLFSEEPEKITGLQKFINELFALLGWTFSVKDNQFGDKVKFLGFIVDSNQRKFRIPDSVAEKVKRMIDVTCEASWQRKLLTVTDMRRVTGKLVSLKLAIPSVTIWLRDTFFCIPENGDDEEPVVLTQQAINGLRTIRSLVERCDGSNFVSPAVDREIFVDSSEVGWGASLLGMDLFGVFSSSVIGQSSTFRELAGLIELLEHPNVLQFIEGKTVRFNMDSKCAIANLVHSGPVKVLSPLTQRVWSILDSMKINPVFRWVSRDTRELQRVDGLSKKGSFRMRDSSRTFLSERLQRPVVETDHNRIPDMITTIVARQARCALFVPRWEGKSWWPVLLSHSHGIVPVEKSNVVYEGGILPGWEFVLALFN